MEFKYIYGIPDREGYRLVKEKLVSLGEQVNHSIHDDNKFGQYPYIGFDGEDWCGYKIATVHFKKEEGIHYDDFISSPDWKEELSKLFNQKIQQ